jgi:DNA helicase HerA-like ATPase
MAHALILGMTESGKTTLAKTLAPVYRAQGIKVGVLDPLGDPGWQADYRTTDPAAFLEAFWSSRQCAWFIDESGDAVGKYDEAMIKTATRGRHWGHRVHYITQRGAQLSRTVRDQCSTLFLFTTSLDDSKIHANEWNKPELRNAHTLRRGEYFHTDRFSPLARGKLF